MGDRTKIEWTRGDDGSPGATWNPIVGCSKVSPGCDHCYAVDVVHRGMAVQHRGLTVRAEGERPDWTGEVRFVESMLDRPLRWKRPRRIFVNSLSDLFHPDVPEESIVTVFAVVALAPQHTFQILTKRPQRMAALVGRPDFEDLVANRVLDVAVNGLGDYRLPATAARNLRARDAHCQMPWLGDWPLRNAWLGVSIESNRYAFRADHLRATPAAVRWISAEPLLGPLDEVNLTGIDWVVAGGESGPGARPMHPDWVRDLRDRCADPLPTDVIDVDATHRVPWYFVTEPERRAWRRANGRPAFLVKQWGAWAPRGRLVDGRPLPVDNDRTLILNVDGNTRGRAAGSLSNQLCEFSDGSHCEVMERVGKSDAGRVLDGRTWDEYPS